MTKKQAEETTEATTPEPTFTKQQFLESKLFSALHKDMISALLQDEETYTTDQVKQKIEAFLREAAE
ncbi:hypothetical protein [Paenibacillus elgii]|uniref:hypothetical protein n=1 Tax=Paenibacillus elgii TaxID=189691 RepID=UPI00203EF5B2|nr:hypothetical protein [Paenibacillus elgii]MCM3273661.1 hypothetical protein [Paenibacillus elgii]